MQLPAYKYTLIHTCTSWLKNWIPISTETVSSWSGTRLKPVSGSPIKVSLRWPNFFFLKNLMKNILFLFLKIPFVPFRPQLLDITGRLKARRNGIFCFSYCISWYVFFVMVFPCSFVYRSTTLADRDGLQQPEPQAGCTQHLSQASTAGQDMLQI